MIQVKRIYDSASEDDGFRVLVDRLWPRGISKENAHINQWMKEIAPSSDLRKWFAHEVDKWNEFKARYMKELLEKEDLINNIRDLEKEHKMVTLLYSAKDTDHNQAVVLLSVLNSK